MPVRAILLDYGGTLDGCASHWLDRFLGCYRAAGLELPFERFREAFDYGTHCGYTTAAVSRMGLEALVQFHVARQLEHLRIEAPAIAAQVSAAFLQASRAALADSRALLARLRPRVALGVISNFYGNLALILEEVGIAPLLDTIIDSGCVGLSKPDPEIFALAVRELGCRPAEALYVGDSFEKDIRGAHQAGLCTAWLLGRADPPCSDPACVDFRIHHLDELEAVIG